jgi:hypothetical protein
VAPPLPVRVQHAASFASNDTSRLWATPNEEGDSQLRSDIKYMGSLLGGNVIKDNVGGADPDSFYTPHSKLENRGGQSPKLDLNPGINQSPPVSGISVLGSFFPSHSTRHATHAKGT